MSTGLSAAQRSVVLQHVIEALSQCERGSFARGQSARPGGVDNVIAHLDTLIEIVRRTTARHIEPYQVQILEDVCDHCPYQCPDSGCSARQRDKCLIQQHAALILDAIATGLVEVRDQSYLTAHPDWQDRTLQVQ